ncbi:MAG: tetratricopeptide repeat protein [Nostocaceae cyanobacterium]|nr:tetratricopeptide repeat protein [Nostocaceae cyanobacterium]
MERYSEAIACYDKGIQFQPDCFKAWNKRGYALVRLGDESEAIDSFNRALKIKPDYADADYNTDACYALQGEVELA